MFSKFQTLQQLAFLKLYSHFGNRPTFHIPLLFSSMLTDTAVRAQTLKNAHTEIPRTLPCLTGTVLSRMQASRCIFWLCLSLPHIKTLNKARLQRSSTFNLWSIHASNLLALQFPQSKMCGKYSELLIWQIFKIPKYWTTSRWSNFFLLLLKSKHWT